MYTELTSALYGKKLTLWKELLAKAGIKEDTSITETSLLWEEDSLLATASREKNIIKCVAVDPVHRGEDLTASVLTQIRQSAFKAGEHHLFLYTKPQNKDTFSSLFFYKIAETDKVLLMESEKDGILSFLNSLSLPSGKKTGAIVMNCNPFTLGHRFLIEKASKMCEKLYIFVLSEDKSYFSFEDRFNMVCLGTQDLLNVEVLPTGPYLISSATFPTYFLKEKTTQNEAHCTLDAEIFAKFYAPHFKIATRFVGTEPFCEVTNEYNRILKKHLQKFGINVTEIPRFEKNGTAISASAVRKAINEKNYSILDDFLPQTTINYLKNKNLI